jgi:hypothetical protein
MAHTVGQALDDPHAFQEQNFSEETDRHSAAGRAAEGSSDLAYRAILPRRLGQFLCDTTAWPAAGACANEGEALLVVEDFATSRQPGAAATEQERAAGRRTAAAPAVKIVSLVCLGLRRVRVEYYRRVKAWEALVIADSGDAEAHSVHSAPVATWPPTGSAGRLTRRMTSAVGRASLLEMRWLVPHFGTAAARVKAEGGGALPSTKDLSEVLAEHGVPVHLRIRWADVGCWLAKLARGQMAAPAPVRMPWSWPAAVGTPGWALLLVMRLVAPA